MGYAPHGPEAHLYPGTCRNLPDNERQRRMESGAPYALRLNCAKAMEIAGSLTWHDRIAGEQEARPELLGDAVLARKDTPMSYHLCVTVDDALQGVNLIIRGRDLFESTHLHRLLQALLGYAAPEYRHHPLLLNDRGEKLSKRDGAVSIRDLRNTGKTTEEVRLFATPA